MPTLFHDISDPVDAVLILLPHEWSDGCAFTSEFSTQVTVARTGIQSRVPEHFIPRHGLTLSYLMDADEADELRTRLLTLAGQRLAIPIWVDDALNDAAWDDWRIFDGPFLTYDGDAGTYTINDAGGLEARKASLLFCRMKGDPIVRPENGQYSTISFEVFEDAPDSLALTYNVVSGESAALPTIDWGQGIREGYISQVQVEQIGQGRELAVRGTEATVRRSQKVGFTMDRAETRKLLRFWLAKRGAWSSFTMGVEYEPGSPTNITATFESDVLEVNFASGEAAQTVANFVEELPLIVDVPAQAQPARAWLYRMQWDGTSIIYYRTSWESEITFGGEDYTPGKFAHDNFKATLKVKGDSIEIVCGEDMASNPFLPFVKLEVERKLLVDVFECDPENPADAVQIFGGSVVKVKTQGANLVAICDQLGGVMEKKIPPALIGTKCNFTLYDVNCGVVRASWAETGTLATQAGIVVEVTTAATGADDFFSNGEATFGTGDTAERRHITRSELIGGGQRLWIHRPLKQTGALAVSMYPGCSGEFGAGGCDKFSNQENFGGSPRQPPYIDAQATSYKPKLGK